MSADAVLRFVPSRVEGLPDVSEVVVRPDRLEVASAGRQVVFRFEDIAQWPRPRRLRRWLAQLGWRPRWLPVADRDWFHRPPDRFFRFYTDPAVTVFMPVAEPFEYKRSTFYRMREVIHSGGFGTFDLG